MIKYATVCFVLILMISACATSVKDNSLSPELKQKKDRGSYILDCSKI